MKNYVHARLNDEESKLLKELKEQTGETNSSLIKKGLKLVYQQKNKRKTALELAGDSVGKFSGPYDLSTNPKHMEGYGRD